MDFHVGEQTDSHQSHPQDDNENLQKNRSDINEIE